MNETYLFGREFENEDFSDILSEIGFSGQTLEEVVENLVNSKDGFDKALAYIDKYTDNILDLRDELKDLESEYNDRISEIVGDEEEANRNRIAHVREYNEYNREISGYNDGKEIEDSIGIELRSIESELAKIYKAEELTNGNISSRLAKKKAQLENRKSELTRDKEDFIELRKETYDLYQRDLNSIKEAQNKRNQIIDELAQRKIEIYKKQSVERKTCKKYMYLIDKMTKNLTFRKNEADAEFEDVQKRFNEAIANGEITYVAALGQEYTDKLNKKNDIDKMYNRVLELLETTPVEVNKMFNVKTNIQEPEIVASTVNVESKYTEEFINKLKDEATALENGELDKEPEIVESENEEEPEYTEEFIKKSEVQQPVAPITEKEPEYTEEFINKLKDEATALENGELDKEPGVVESENEEEPEYTEEFINKLKDEATALENGELDKEPEVVESENEAEEKEEVSTEENQVQQPSRVVESVIPTNNKPMTLEQLAAEVEKNGPIFKDEERIDSNHQYMTYQNANNLGYASETLKTETKEKEAKKHKSLGKRLKEKFSKNKSEAKEKETIESTEPVEKTVEPVAPITEEEPEYTEEFINNLKDEATALENGELDNTPEELETELEEKPEEFIMESEVQQPVAPIAEEEPEYTEEFINKLKDEATALENGELDNTPEELETELEEKPEEFIKESEVQQPVAPIAEEEPEYTEEFINKLKDEATALENGELDNVSDEKEPEDMHELYAEEFEIQQPEELIEEEPEEISIVEENNDNENSNSIEVKQDETHDISRIDYIPETLLQKISYTWNRFKYNDEGFELWKAGQLGR